MISKCYVLLIFILLTFFPFIELTHSQPSLGYNLSESQTQFAQNLNGSVPGVISASWQSPIDLWVEADEVDVARAKEIALDVIFEGRDILGQSFCVHVHNGDWKQIAMTCWSSP